MNPKLEEFGSGCEGGRAFTLIELLVVIATLAIFAAMVLPALAGTKPHNQTFQCMNNLRQLQRGWFMYSGDNNDRIVPTIGQGGGQVSFLPDPRTAPGHVQNQWIYGTMSSPIVSTNTELLKVGLMFPYVPNIKAFKCPADPRTQNFPGGGQPTVRSVSMNAYMNPIGGMQGPLNSQYRIFKKQGDLAVIGSGNTWVMMDENPYSINDGWFVINPDPAAPEWIDYPAAYHNSAGVLSFADGRVEIKKWRDQNMINYRVSPPGNRTPFQSGTDDLHWLGQRSSIR